jgi:hypothetical protein
MSDLPEFMEERERLLIQQAELGDHIAAVTASACRAALEVLDYLPGMVSAERHRQGLSLRAAADEMGVAFTTLNRLERGEGIHLEAGVQAVRWLARSGVEPVVPPD